MSDSARVCIAIITYNSAATLSRCLDSLAAQTFRDFRVLIIDNLSSERPRALVENRPFAIDYREMTENLGFAGGMNVALEAAAAPFLVALNPDAFPAPDWLAALVAAADLHPEVAAFGSIQREALDPLKLDGIGDHYLAFGQAWRGRTWPKDEPPGLWHCFGVCAAAALYRTEALRTIGGFDGRFFCFYEDVDVSFRLRLAGAQCAVVPTAVVHHVGGASFEGKSDFAEYLIARNQWWVLIKNMPLPLLLAALPGYAALQIYGALRHPRSARVRGLWAGLRRSREFFASRRSNRIGLRALLPWLSWSLPAFLAQLTLVRPAPEHSGRSPHGSSGPRR